MLSRVAFSAYNVVGANRDCHIQALPIRSRRGAAVSCAPPRTGPALSVATEEPKSQLRVAYEPTSLADRLRLGSLAEDGFSYREKFIIRCYEVGINKTATVETIANLLQEVGCSHAQSVGFSTDGFATTHTMRKLHLIWVTARMHIEIYRYPAWSDVVEIETWCQTEGRIGTRRDWILKDFATGEVIGRATRELKEVEATKLVSRDEQSTAESSRTPLIVPSTRESHSQGGERRWVDKNPRKIVPDPESLDLSQPRNVGITILTNEATNTGTQFSRSEGMEEVSLELLKKKMEDFVKERDWEKHHTPRNLLLNMIGEVGELSEIFQWKGEVAKGLPDWDEAEKVHLGEELSDVLLNLVRLSDVCGIDLGKAALRKVQLNALKYPPPTHHSPTKTQP
nr:oleoyl-acyl carrier protein thioesterase, chloroplastic [Ipomoea batatas]